ncbi:DUF7089 family protein [Halovenus salina]|uniref:Uncharacterized protein n=1 Tax=Halovenus salina TaxID=1510225 RepID=A0ABD5W3R0_9EURY|nr:hypothetical protein [Halovenus salina]
MFTERTLSEPLKSVKERHAPDALVLDSAENFESLLPAQAEDLLLVTDSVVPATYPDEWVPPNSPEVLARYASSDFIVGMPGDGSVVWTHQTDPSVVICKPRLEESPDSFAEFLVAEALVEVGLDAPEHFLGLFESDYPRFAAACADLLSPAETYQVAVACHDAYLGLQTRDVFADWEEPLFEAWADASDRLEPRVDGLPGEMARNETSFAEAAELACSAVKHAGELPPPFEALDASVYLDHGSDYAVEWAERTVDALADG